MAMRVSGYGSIINLASVSGMVGWGGSAAYVASKGGVIALTRQLAVDYAPDKVRVHCVCPGSIWAPMVEEQFALYPTFLQSSLQPLPEQITHIITIEE